MFRGYLGNDSTNLFWLHPTSNHWLTALSFGGLICFLKCRENKLTKLDLRKIYITKSPFFKKAKIQFWTHYNYSAKGKQKGQKQWGQHGLTRTRQKGVRHHIKQPRNWLPPTNLSVFFCFASPNLDFLPPSLLFVLIDQQCRPMRDTDLRRKGKWGGWKELLPRTCACF